jgi:PAS domain-containing protein
MNAPTPEPSPHGSRDLFQHLMDGIAEPVIVKDDASRFIFINDAACDLLGKDR